MAEPFCVCVWQQSKAALRSQLRRHPSPAAGQARPWLARHFEARWFGGPACGPRGPKHTGRATWSLLASGGLPGGFTAASTPAMPRAGTDFAACAASHVATARRRSLMHPLARTRNCGAWALHIAPGFVDCCSACAWLSKLPSQMDRSVCRSGSLSPGWRACAAEPRGRRLAAAHQGAEGTARLRMWRHQNEARGACSPHFQACSKLGPPGSVLRLTAQRSSSPGSAGPRNDLSQHSPRDAASCPRRP